MNLLVLMIMDISITHIAALMALSQTVKFILTCKAAMDKLIAYGMLVSYLNGEIHQLRLMALFNTQLRMT